MKKLGCLLAAAALLVGCNKNYTAYALTSTGTILKFETNKPATVTSSASVSGLSSGVGLAAIAYQPSSGTLYCVTSANTLCTVNPDTGVAALVSTTSATFFTGTLSGQTASFDPVVNQLRVITAQQNLRVNPADGTQANAGTAVAYDSSDTNNGKSPQIAAIAYNNQTSSAANATLYALDSTTGSLVRVGDSGTSSTTSADSGDLHTVGSVGVSFNTSAGFVVEQVHGTAYAALQQSGSGAVLYTIDLSSGAATSVGAIGDGQQTLIGLVVPPGQ
ncbi:MAG: DUF4394 domain-containing protein [Nevskia sp.]|nr:DUF4394 domain-containing protein [Nevskia sp.]